MAKGADGTDVASIYLLSYSWNTIGIGYMAIWGRLLNKMSEWMDGWVTGYSLDCYDY